MVSVHAMLTVAGLLLQLLSVCCFATVLAHAFRAGLGTGVAVLLLPPWGLFYGFARFEHRARALVLAGWLSALILSVLFRVAGATETG